MLKRHLKFCFFVLLSSFTAPCIVFADCKYSKLEGYWEAQSYSKLVPKKLEILQNCKKSSKHRYGGPGKWVMRVFNSCYPKDCIWGRSVAKKGRYGDLVARFETFSASRYVKVSPYNNRLKVYYKIDYRSEKRKDLVGTIYMIRKK